ncbi:MAG TPA: sensor histidine kinase [Dehalococcoidia bacterium]|nr:sensor histidine kinase [Dehalococcoidia bacterium]
MARIEASIEDFGTRVASLPRGFWRRGRADTSLETLPGGIRLAVLTSPFIVRWAAWLVAVLIVVIANEPRVNVRFEPWLLLGTMVQTALVTFYVPVIRPALLPVLRRWFETPENNDVLVLGLADLTLSMTAVYLSGGWGSPYYHFALTALLIPAFFFTFRGVLLLGGAFMAAYVFGLMTFGDGVHGGWKDTNLNSFIGAMVTPLLVALVPNYLGTVLRELDAARQDAVEALGDSDLLYRVARAFLEGARQPAAVLPNVAASAVEESRFSRVALLVPRDGAVQAFGTDLDPPPELERLRTAFDAEGARTWLADALPPPLDAALRGCAWCGVVPLRSSDGIEGWVVAGALERPASILHQIRLLDAMAGQIALGVRNIRLTARVAELAAEYERGRIAREIHDGIAQMVYMLSLSLETAIDRVGSDPAEQRQRLKDLTALAKHALWEVRQYIFDLRPLLSGDEGLAGAVQGQVQEFQAVSDLPVDFVVRGEPGPLPMETSAALYRIVQEGLGNIFRHAQASHVAIELAFRDASVALAISDDGVGISDAEPGARVGYGMANLRERVEALRGTLAVRSEPGEGTRIEVAVPVGGDT